MLPNMIFRCVGSLVIVCLIRNPFVTSSGICTDQSNATKSNISKSVAVTPYVPYPTQRNCWNPTKLRNDDSSNDPQTADVDFPYWNSAQQNSIIYDDMLKHKNLMLEQKDLMLRSERLKNEQLLKENELLECENHNFTCYKIEHVVLSYYELTYIKMDKNYPLPENFNESDAYFFMELIGFKLSPSIIVDRILSRYGAVYDVNKKMIVPRGDEATPMLNRTSSNIARIEKWVWMLQTIRDIIRDNEKFLMIAEKELHLWVNLIFDYEQRDCNILCLANIVVRCITMANKAMRLVEPSSSDFDYLDASNIQTLKAHVANVSNHFKQCLENFRESYFKVNPVTKKFDNLLHAKFTSRIIPSFRTIPYYILFPGWRNRTTDE